MALLNALIALSHSPCLCTYKLIKKIGTNFSPREPRLPIDVSLLPPTDLSTSVNEHRKRIVLQIDEAQRLAKQNTEHFKSCFHKLGEFL